MRASLEVPFANRTPGFHHQTAGLIAVLRSFDPARDPGTTGAHAGLPRTPPAGTHPSTEPQGNTTMADDRHDIPDDRHDISDDKPVLFGWTRREGRALGLVAAVAGVWGGSYALFGFAGLIVPALLMVAAAFALLLLITRG